MSYSQPSVGGGLDARAFITNARYRKLVWFFGLVLLHALWWELLLRKVVLLRRLSERTMLRRWQIIARRYRAIAVEMGGVLIKLGQFLSIRVDVLPAEVVRELAGLQDEVPPESIDKIRALIEADFGRPVEAVFASFETAPLAAASLAQAHRAVLPDGEAVVVKVQRPGIDEIVDIDLAAIALALRWLKLYPRINQRADLDLLAKEFTTVTRNELDFEAEGHNAERFARDFEHDPGVYVPQVYWAYSRARVLTMEDVGYIRIADLVGIEAAGIDRADLARKLYGIYMHQIFKTHFIHVDAHPGNLFVRPLPRPVHLNGTNPTPFQVIFIDFGMVATVPERLRKSLRKFAIGLGTRDARLLVEAYDDAGALLPGADKRRLEEVHRVMFDRFWGVSMSQIKDLAMVESEALFEEYKDLVYDAPFQFQSEMLFTMRAVGLLSGLTTSIDPDFDPWAETMPFAQELAEEELSRNWQEWLLEIGKILSTSATLPGRLSTFLQNAERGSLPLETTFSFESKRNLRRLESSVNRLTWAVVSMAVMVSGVVLRVFEGANDLNTGVLLAAAGLFLWKVLR